MAWRIQRTRTRQNFWIRGKFFYNFHGDFFSIKRILRWVKFLRSRVFVVTYTNANEEYTGKLFSFHHFTSLELISFTSLGNFLVKALIAFGCYSRRKKRSPLSVGIKSRYDPPPPPKFNLARKKSYAFEFPLDEKINERGHCS